MKSVRFPGFTHRFEVSGLNLERFLNSVHKADIPLLHVRRTEGRALECACYSADLLSIRSLADEKGWRIQHCVPLKLSATLAWMKRRPGIAAGAVVALIVALVLSQFIWAVEIHNAGSYEAEIAAYLEQSGCTPGRLRGSIDAAALERDLTYRYPDITWFHVYASGVTLVVDVTHGIPMPTVPSQEPYDLVASRGGIVESIRVYAGTPMVKAGDIVQKGQVLIRGTERAADEQLSLVHAEGEVLARCWMAHTVEVPLYEIQSEETGRETVRMRIRTPWWTQPLESLDYLAYNTYMEEFPVAGSFFPVFLQRVTQREVSMQYIPRQAEQVQKEASQAALKVLKTKLFGYEIIDKWVDYCMIEGDTLAATATAEWLMDIGDSSSP